MKTTIGVDFIKQNLIINATRINNRTHTVYYSSGVSECCSQRFIWSAVLEKCKSCIQFPLMLVSETEAIPHSSSRQIL